MKTGVAGFDMQKKNTTIRSPKAFLGIFFKCCNTYGRIYKNREQTAYTGMCPRCGKKVEAGIGREGTDARFFTAR